MYIQFHSNAFLPRLEISRTDLIATNDIEWLKSQALRVAEHLALAGYSSLCIWSDDHRTLLYEAKFSNVFSYSLPAVTSTEAT